MFFFFFSFFSVWLSHSLGCYLTVSSLRFFSGHSGPVLTLSMQPVPPCLAPACWWPTQASGLLLRWQLWLGAYSGGFFFFFSSLSLLLVMLPSEIPKLPMDPSVRGFHAVWKLFLYDYLPRMDLHPSLFCLSFCLLYFVLPPFKENRLPFWVSGVLCQHSEVVLWKLLSIQMIF